MVVIALGCSGFEVDLRASEPESSAVNSQSAEQPELTTSNAGRPSIPMKIRRYCRWLMSKYDLNRDGVLQENEWLSLQGQPQQIDSNGDHTIDLDELTRWTADYGAKREIGISHELPPPNPISKNHGESDEEDSEQPDSTRANLPAGGRRRDLKFYVSEKRLPAGLPDWFLSRDEDGDAQLTLAEFSPTGLASDAIEFARYDVNRDGVMTAQECVGRAGEKSASIKASADTNVDEAKRSEAPTGRRKSRPKSK